MLEDLEHHLVEACKSGDARAMERLYKHFYSYAMSVALRYAHSKDEAGEIINDSFMKVFDKIDQHDPRKSLKAWLRRFIVNNAIDYYRKNVKHYALMQIEKVSVEVKDESAIDRLSAQDIMDMMGQLPDPYRVVFNLYEIEGYTHQEIGEMLGIPASTSRTYLSRAKQKLRTLCELKFSGKYEGAI